MKTYQLLSLAAYQIKATPKDIAHKCNVPEDIVKSWLTGDEEPDGGLVPQIAEALNVHESYIYNTLNSGGKNETTTHNGNVD